MEKIQISGVKELSLAERTNLQRFAERYYEKIKRMVKNEVSLKVHVKCHNKEGSRRKYSIRLQAIAPTLMFASIHGNDWSLQKAIHKAFQDIEHQMQHKLKLEGKKQIQKPSKTTRIPSSKRKINRK